MSDYLTVYLIVLLFMACVFSGLGGWISAQKGRDPIEGAVLGFLFGPLGALVAALLPNRERPGRARSWSPAPEMENEQELNVRAFLGGGDDTDSQRRNAAFLDSIARADHTMRKRS